MPFDNDPIVGPAAPAPAASGFDRDPIISGGFDRDPVIGPAPAPPPPSPLDTAAAVIARTPGLNEKGKQAVIQQHVAAATPPPTTTGFSVPAALAGDFAVAPDVNPADNASFNNQAPPDPNSAGLGETIQNAPRRIASEFLKQSAGLHSFVGDMPILPGQMVIPGANAAIADASRQGASQLTQGLRPPGSDLAQAADTIAIGGANLVPALAAAPFTGPIGPAVIMGAQSLGRTQERVRERIIEQGGTPAQADEIARPAALTAGLLGAAAGGIAPKIPGADKLGPYGASAVEGLVLGGAQTAGEEAAVSRVTGDRPAWEQVPVNAGIGGAVGVGLTLLGNILTRGRVKLSPHLSQALEQEVRQAKTPQEVQTAVRHAEAMTAAGEPGAPPQPPMPEQATAAPAQPAQAEQPQPPAADSSVQPAKPVEQPVEPVANAGDGGQQGTQEQLPNDVLLGGTQGQSEPPADSVTAPRSRAEQIVADEPNPNVKASWDARRQRVMSLVAAGKKVNPKALEPFRGEPWVDEAETTTPRETSPDALAARRKEVQQQLRDVVVQQFDADVADQPYTSSHVMRAMRGEGPPGAMISLQGTIRAAEEAPEGHPTKLVLHNLRELEKNPRGTKVQAVNTIDKENGMVEDGVRGEIPEGGLTIYGTKTLPPTDNAPADLSMGTKSPQVPPAPIAVAKPDTPAPTLTRASRAGDIIYLAADATGAAPDAATLRQQIRDLGFRAEVNVPPTDILTGAAGNRAVRIDVEGGEAKAKALYEKMFGSDAPIHTQSEFERAAPLGQRFEAARQAMGASMGLRQSSEPPARRPTFFSADETGTSREQTGIFGQPEVFNATGKQDRMAYETERKELPRPAGDDLDASKNAVNPQNTPTFEATPAKAPTLREVRAEAENVLADAQAKGETITQREAERRAFYQLRNRMRPSGKMYLPPNPLTQRPKVAGDVFTLGGESPVDKFLRIAQDEFRPLQRMQEDVAKGGGTITEASDPYLKQELFRGRAANEIRAVEQETVEPIVKKMTDAGLSVEDVDEYLYALHAPERNAQVAKVNPSFSGLLANGSGMSDADAARVVAKFTAAGKKPALDDIAAHVHAMNDATLQRQVDAGLLDPAAAATMRSTYKQYVPLRSDMEAEGVSSTRQGKGFSVRGKEGERATGRGSMADSPLTFSLVQAQEKIVRAEKNRVGQSLLKLVRDNPDPKLWTINDVPTKTIIDPKTGLTRQQVDPLFQYADNVVPVKENGKTHLIEFKGTNGTTIAAAVKRLNYQDGGRVVQVLGKAMRAYAAMQTTLNPEFIVPNLVRDVQTAAINLSSEKSAAIAAKTVKGLPQAGKAMWDIAGDRNAKRGSEYHDYAREYTRAGGRVDAYHLASFENTGKHLERMLASANPSPRQKLVIGAKRAGEFVDRLSGSVEQATRLSAYVEARKSGMSVERAASLAKNLTVNFERKGEVGAFFNALYLFSNAAIQGNARMFKAMASTRRGRILATSIAGSGLAYGLFAPLMFGTDDEGRNVYDTIPNQIKASNLIIPAGGTKYVKIPMPYGYNTLFTAGRLVGETASGRQSPAAAGANLLDTAVNAFNPLGNEGSLSQTLAPTILDPFVQASENKDWTGRAIVPDQPKFGPAKPQSQLARRDTGPMAKAAAEFLNRATGGDEVTSGKVDVSPALIEHFIGWASGGVGRTLLKTYELPAQIAKGDVPPNKVPIVSRFVGEEPRGTNAREFYDVLKNAEDAKSDLKHYEIGQPAKAAALRASKARDLEFYRWGDKLRSQIKDLRDGDRDAEADAKMSAFLKAYRTGELPPRWQFENELGDLRAAHQKLSDAKKAKDFKVLRELNQQYRGFARLRLLERDEKLIRKWDTLADEHKLPQAEADRRVESLVRARLKKAG